MSNILECKNLSHLYGKDTPFQRLAIDNISFSVKKGEVLGLIGHTGSGKSTLIQHLNGLIKAQEGTVLFDGNDIWAKDFLVQKIRFKVGLVFQYPEYQLFEETIEKDIAFGPSNMGLSKEDIEKRVFEAMDFVGLDRSLKDKSPFELSGGQKRRVAIAGVVAMNPDVLILDEPTAGLDPRGRDDILAHILEYHKKTGASIVIVTHSMDDIAKMADRILVLKDGQILLEGEPSYVFSKADIMSESGLDVPEVTKIFEELRKRGKLDNKGIYTIDNALEYIKSIKGDM